jgi:hypothetical protein
MKTPFKTFGVLLAVIVAAGSARAGYIYDNSSNDSGYRLMLTNSQVVGQEIYPNSASLAAFPYLTGFSFEYFSTNMGWSGTVQADVKFYLNNGTPFNGFNTPGTSFFDSGWFNLVNPEFATGGSVLGWSFSSADLYSGGGAVLPLNYNLAMPSDFTVVFTLQGLSGADQVGLAVFNPPATGTNYGDYWMKDNANQWELVTNNVTTIGLGMQFNGSATPAPEPSVLALGALGALLLARVAKRRQ